MHRRVAHWFTISFIALPFVLCGQTLYVPSGTSGIGNNTANANVGIGTSSPSTKLEVAGAIKTTDTTASTSTSTGAMIVGGGLGVAGQIYAAGIQGTPIGGVTPSTGAFTTISATGVISGTNTTGHTFAQFTPASGYNHYIDNLRIGSYLVFRVSAASSADTNAIIIDGGGTTTFYQPPALQRATSDTGYMELQWKDASTYRWSLGLRNGDHDFHVWNEGSGADVVNFTAAGVGVTGTLNTTGATNLATTTGNVGIGTSSPSAPLHVLGNSSREVARFQGGNDTSNYRNYISLYTTNPAFWWEISNQDPSGTGSYNGLAFRERSGGGSSVERVYFAYGGNVGIGTTNPAYKLSVNGTVRAKEVIVDTGWSDYVFADDYHLEPLSEVEAHIKANRHLPGIPSAQQVEEHGVSVGEMQAKLLAKIEELTLHQIEQEKEIAALRHELRRALSQ